MGINYLLQFCKEASRETHVSEFKGGTAAIDINIWLHSGGYICADKLAMGQPTKIYIHYCMKFVNKLLSQNIKPILVFDGCDLPAKEQTHARRRASRYETRKKAIELMEIGERAEAKKLFRKSMNITHEVALELIKHCQKLNIDCIVAPYEADAELAYLNLSGIADVVITDDKDLILFGCKKVFFTMDTKGYGVLVDNDQLHLTMGVKSEDFRMDKFLYMGILSGCDYLPGLPCIGLGKAKKFIAMNTGDDIYEDLTRLSSSLKIKSLVVTKEYQDSFVRAVIAYKHQLVFCPLQRKQVRLTPPTPDITDEQLYYAGQQHTEDLAFQLALGNCDPSTYQMLHDYDPDALKPSPVGAKNRWQNSKLAHFTQQSIWSKDFVLKNKEGFYPHETNTWRTSVDRQMILGTTRIKQTEVKEKEIEDLVDKGAETAEAASANGQADEAASVNGQADEAASAKGQADKVEAERIAGEIERALEWNERKRNIIISGLKVGVGDEMRVVMELMGRLGVGAKVEHVRRIGGISTDPEIIARLESVEKKREVMARKGRLGKKGGWIHDYVTWKEIKLLNRLREIESEREGEDKRVRVTYG